MPPPLFSCLLLASDSTLQWKRTIGHHEVVKAYSAWEGWDVQDERDNEIYTIDATGGKPFQVTNNKDKQEFDPSWGVGSSFSF